MRAMEADLGRGKNAFPRSGRNNGLLKRTCGNTEYYNLAHFFSYPILNLVLGRSRFLAVSTMQNIKTHINLRSQ